MAMLKTLARKERGCKDIKVYLERDGRSLGIDSSDSVMDVEHWDAWMDATRTVFDKDTGRRYYHFVISPDPKDGVDLKTLRKIATSWARERYPDGEWVIEYHDDNGIPHAHVVLNAVIPQTGLKVHLDSDDIRKDASALQSIAAENGCSVMDGFEVIRGEDGEWLARSDYARRERQDRAKRRRVRSTAQQEWMRRNGIHLWKDDMREAIESSISICRTWNGFARELSRRGYTVREGRRGQITFYPPEGEGYPTKGYKLDDSYTVSGIRARLSPRIGRDIAGIMPAPHTKVAIPRSLEANLLSATRRARRKGASERRMEAAIDAINIVKANGYTNLNQMREATNDLLDRARLLDERLEEAKNACDQLDDAVRKTIEIQACRERMTPRPRGRMALARWAKENEAELAVIADNEAWLKARGIDEDATRESLRERAADLFEQAEEIAQEAERISDAAQRFEDALTALRGIPVPAYAGGRQKRGVRESHYIDDRFGKPKVYILDVQETRNVLARKLEEEELLRRELSDRAAEAQRVMYMQRLQEEALAVDASRENDSVDTRQVPEAQQRREETQPISLTKATRRTRL